MRRTVFMVLAIAAMAWAGAATAADDLKPPFGWADADGDGRNDRFRDANGDGVDDVTGKAYRHTFQFRDANGDGKNDLFCDANGDGVNDLFAPGTQAGRRGLARELDADGDGRNDVTGAPLSGGRGRGMHGGRHGMGGMDDFIDEDGDGIDDRRAWGPHHHRWRYGAPAQGQNGNSGDSGQQPGGQGSGDGQDDSEQGGKKGGGNGGGR